MSIGAYPVDNSEQIIQFVRTEESRRQELEAEISLLVARNKRKDEEIQALRNALAVQERGHKLELRQRDAQLQSKHQAMMSNQAEVARLAGELELEQNLRTALAESAAFAYKALREGTPVECDDAMHRCRLTLKDQGFRELLE